MVSSTLKQIEIIHAIFELFCCVHCHNWNLLGIRPDGNRSSDRTENHQVPAETYGVNIRNLIHKVREDTGVNNFPFMMLQVGSGKVVEGMRAAARTMKNVSFIPQSKDPNSPAYLPGYGPPTGHYNYEGMKRIGQPFASIYLSEYAKNTRTPRTSTTSLDASH